MKKDKKPTQAQMKKAIALASQLEVVDQYSWDSLSSERVCKLITSFQVQLGKPRFNY